MRFACDAMLGALARWLRAAGYDAFWREGIDDADLVELARREARILLTSDTGILRRNVVRRGEVRALHVDRDRPRDEQVAMVLHALGLPRRGPRCMACGGELGELDRVAARRVVPPEAFARNEQFFRCRRCGQVYWPGTHWLNIDRRLRKRGLELDEGAPDKSGG